MQSVDGDVRLSVGLDTKPVEENIKQLTTTVKKALSSVAASKSSGAGTEKVSKGASEASKAFLSLSKNAKSAFSTIVKNSKNAAKSAGSSFLNINKIMSNGVKTLLAYTIGVRGLFALFGKLKSSISEGYKNLAVYSNDVNTSISTVLSALTKLKNSLAAAFQPIVDVVTPILTSLINKLSDAARVVGQFFATLTGQDYVYQAVKVQTNYADSLDDTASAANKAKKALNGYLSPLDEINRYTEPQTDTSSLSGAINAEDMFETVEVGNQFKDLAEKIKGYFGTIKDYITSEDWEGLGSYIAKGFNKGLQKLKDIVSWDNLKEPITKTIDSITDYINSFVSRVDWELLGETVGEGINTLVNTFDEFTSKIDWNKIGEAISDSINGLTTAADWQRLGKSMADKMNILPKTLLSFAKKLNWKDVGDAIGDGIQGFIESFDLDSLAEAVGTTFTGILKTIDSAIKKINWKDLAKKIKNGFSSLFKSISFKDIGKLISDLLKGALDFVIEMTNPFDGFLDDTAKGIGNAIGDLIANIDWFGIISGAMQLVGNAIVTAFKAPQLIAEAIIGLGDSIASAIVSSQFGSNITATFSSQFESSLEELNGIADNIADGINQRLEKIGDVTADFGVLDQYMQRFDELMNIADLTPAEEAELNTILDYLKKNVPGASDLLNTYFDTVGTNKTDAIKYLQDIQGEIHKTIEDYKKLALVEAYRELAQESTKEYIQAKRAHEEIKEQMQERADGLHNLDVQMGNLWNEWKTLMDKSEASGWLDTDKQNEILNQLPLLIDKAKEYGIEIDGEITSYRNLEELQGKVSEGYFTIVGSIEENEAELEKLRGTTDDYFDSIAMLTTDGIESAERALGLFADGLINEQDVINLTGKTVEELQKKLDEFGMTNDTVSDKIKSKTEQTAVSIETGEKRIEDSLGDAQTAAVTTRDTFESSFGKSENVFHDFYDSADKAMSDTAKSVKNNVDGMIEKLKELLKAAGKKTLNLGVNIAASLPSEVSGYMSARSAVASAMSSSAPRTGTATASTLSANIPKLAQGAVLPPNKPFLTIVGDQKNGDNLEAPEALIRRIVREEAGGNNGGGTYEFIAQINRRTIFDEIIDEAKRRQTVNGRNPFELA